MRITSAATKATATSGCTPSATRVMRIEHHNTTTRAMTENHELTPLGWPPFVSRFAERHEHEDVTRRHRQPVAGDDQVRKAVRQPPVAAALGRARRSAGSRTGFPAPPCAPAARASASLRPAACSFRDSITHVNISRRQGRRDRFEGAPEPSARNIHVFERRHVAAQQPHDAARHDGRRSRRNSCAVRKPVGDDAAIDRGQRFEVGDRHAFVDHVHGLCRRGRIRPPGNNLCDEAGIGRAADVDRTGALPVTAVTASETVPTSFSSRVRKTRAQPASATRPPPSAPRTCRARRCVAAAPFATRASISAFRLSASQRSLKRMLKASVASPE